MKPDQNNGLRSRPMGARRESNPLTRTYESNGPDVKIRGTARHLADKYLQLARDAHRVGDPVSAENHLQHAEHYFRLIAAAQEGSRATDETHRDDSEDENDDGGLLNRVTKPAEPAPQPMVVQTAAYLRKVG